MECGLIITVEALQSSFFELVCRVFVRRNLSQEARRPLPCMKSGSTQPSSARAPNTTTPEKVDSMHADSPLRILSLHTLYTRSTKKLHAVHNPPIPTRHLFGRVVASSDLGRDKATGLDSSGIPLASITSSQALTGKPLDYRR